MMISGGRFGITASNSNFSPCVFAFQQTHVLPLLRNGFAITICLPAGFFYSWSLLGFTLSVCAHHIEPSLAPCVQLQTNHTWKEGGKAFSLWKIAGDMHPAFWGLVQASTRCSACPLNSLCCAITDCKLLINHTASLDVHLSLSSASPCDWWQWMCACWQHQVSHPWEFRAGATTMNVVQLALT